MAPRSTTNLVMTVPKPTPYRSTVNDLVMVALELLPA